MPCFDLFRVPQRRARIELGDRLRYVLQAAVAVPGGAADATVLRTVRCAPEGGSSIFVGDDGVHRELSLRGTCPTVGDGGRGACVGLVVALVDHQAGAKCSGDGSPARGSGDGATDYCYPGGRYGEFPHECSPLFLDSVRG